MIVANTEKYKQFGFAQQVGKVLEISEDYVTIHWYEGGLTTKRTPWLKRKTKKGTKCVPWTENISITDILINGFELTKKGCLPSDVKRVMEDKTQEQNSTD